MELCSLDSIDSTKKKSFSVVRLNLIISWVPFSLWCIVLLMTL
uniref:Uncharacterized protein n=1 Tax=Lepeophtheirus salmonis TaxID=72036 RepID=A0A0K2TXS6_LEPSM